MFSFLTLLKKLKRELMLYDLDKPDERKCAEMKLAAMTGRVELRQYRQRRSLQQNKYLHVCIALVGLEMGHTLKEAKTLLKRECPAMVYEKNGHRFLRSTAKLDTGELAAFIDFICNFASANLALYIPSPEEWLENQYAIDREIAGKAQYL